MTRFAWRQFRAQAIIGALALLVVGVVIAITGPHLFHLYDTEIKGCKALHDCSSVNAAFAQNDRTLRTWLGILVIALPGVIGIFWGAPLVARELESDLHRLTWTQSITRTRWLATKLMVVGLASAVVAGLLSLIVTWWSSRLDAAAMDVYGTFDLRDVVPVGYAVFAFTLGVTAGVVIRKMLPAMATTLVIFVAVRLAFDRLVRVRLLASNVLKLPLNQNSAGFGSANGGPFTLFPNAPTIHDAWITSIELVNRDHQLLSSEFAAKSCPRLVSSGGGGGQPTGLGGLKPSAATNQLLKECFARVGATYHELLAYEPASHYWTMQWYETAIYLCASVGLALFCVWWIQRRRS
jgi:hypothetical protein